MTPSRADRLKIASLVILAAGAIVAALGVRTAVGSYQREQGLKEYAAVLARADLVTDVGTRAEEAGADLCGCDEERGSLFREAIEAYEAADPGRYNDLVSRQNELAAQANALGSELAALRNQLAPS